MSFSNINISCQNFSFGPDSGRIYSINHLTSTLIIKTLAGELVSSVSLSHSLPSEVLELEWDGFYFYTLIQNGLGITINKWLLQSTLIKQLGTGNEINLLSTSNNIIESEAFCVQKYETSLSQTAILGTNQVVLNSTAFLAVGDTIYLGPSTYSSGQRIERKVLGVTGSTVTLDTPVNVQFNATDKVIYKKNLWVFNNRNGVETGGSLLQIGANGSIMSRYSSTQWKNVTAASSYNGNLAMVRGSQFLVYQPFGVNSGFQSSALLRNMETNNTTIIKVYDIAVSGTIIYKLQKKKVEFNLISYEWQEVIGDNNNYHLDTEPTSSRINSITVKRDRSVLFGPLTTADFVVGVRDQFDIPISNRSFSIQEDDPSGTIPVGYTTFTTDSNGEGITRYNSGSNPDFRSVKVLAIDTGTQYRLPFYINQQRGLDSKALIDQRSKISVPTSIEQRKVASSSILDQISRLQSGFNVIQTSVKTSSVLEQFKTEGQLGVDQQSRMLNKLFVDQLGKTQSTASLDQYEFLTFAFPKPYSIKNSVDTNITIRLIGFGSVPLNAETLEVKINGFDVTSDILVTPFTGGLQLEYNPPVSFDYASIVSVFISIQDTEAVPRTITTSYYFEVVGDYKKPTISNVYPPPLSIGNLTDTVIYVTIKDNETKINKDSVVLYVAGVKVPVIIGDLSESEVKISYFPEYLLPYSGNIFATIMASDLAGNRIVYTWNFRIKESPGVLFTHMSPEVCDVLVPIDSKVCAEVFGKEAGVNRNSIEVSMFQQDVEFALKPKVLREK